MTHKKPGLIAARVLDDQGAPIPGARVFFTSGPASFPDMAALTDDHGAVTLGAPVAGTYTLQAVADGFVAREVKVTVGAGQKESVDIPLAKA